MNVAEQRVEEEEEREGDVSDDERDGQPEDGMRSGLPRRKDRGEQAETRPGRVLRLGELRLPERRVRLVASNLSAGDAVAEKIMGHRSANGKSNASEPGMS